MLQLYVLKYLGLRYICVITSTPILILALLNYKDAYSDSCFQNSKSQFTVANNFHHFWERSVNCNVHGPINVVEPLSCIIDTPPFQRLHYLKQIGLCYMVFPTAKHTRFEHSLGTYHLAFQFAKRLMDLYPNFVDKRDVLCVSIAGLIHDLGHGPFSHFFDGPFLKTVSPNNNWRHENGTILMWEYLLETNPEVYSRLREFLNESDFVFIKELINPPKGLWKDNNWQLKGRSSNKSFLYAIVSNPFDGLDVDKLDYLLRDSSAAVVPIWFSKNIVERLLEHYAVGEVDRFMRPAFDKKVVDDYNLAVTCRMRLHDTIYKHKTAIAVEKQVLEILTLADPYLKFAGQNGKLYTLSESIKDMEAFRKTDDEVLTYIRNSWCDELEPARKLLDDLEHRRIYRMIGSLQFKNGNQANDAITSIKKHFSTYLEPDKYFIDRSEIHQVFSLRNFVRKSVFGVLGLGLNDYPICKLLVFEKNELNQEPKPLSDGQLNLKEVPNYVNVRIFLHQYDKPPAIVNRFKSFMSKTFETKQFAKFGTVSVMQSQIVQPNAGSSTSTADCELDLCI